MATLIPLTQTFSIESTAYPSGVYVSSIDLYFSGKDTTLPVTLFIGPIDTATGNPDFETAYPLAICTKYPSTVNTSVSGDLSTRFTFETPIYLSPGLHYFAVSSNSQYYFLYTAVQGQAQFGSSSIISLPPYTGYLILPSNQEPIIKSQEEDIKFVINRCLFNKASGSVVLKNNYETLGSSNAVPVPVQTTINRYFNLFNISSDVVDEFEDTNITHSYKKTAYSSNTLDASYSTFLPETNVEIEKSILNVDTFKVKVDLSTTNNYLSPFVDLDRINGAFINFEINNDTTGETGKVGGSALSKYVTKVVELLPDIDANDLVAYCSLKLPVNTNVKMYYKAAPAGVNIVTDVSYVEMTRTAVGTPNTDEFVEYKFSTPTGYALSNGGFFNKFLFKIVLLSNSTSGDVPVVKDFRAIALYD